MPQRYAREFRREICERLLAGERISKVSNETGVSPATLHRWKDQALIDAGLKEGTKSIEVDELAQARKTIEELEAELAAVKAASALFNGEEPVSPKGGARLPKA
jgi:transposase